VIVPSRAADPAPTITDLRIAQEEEEEEDDDDQITCGFTLGSRPYRFAWTTTGLDRLPIVRTPSGA